MTTLERPFDANVMSQLVNKIVRDQVILLLMRYFSVLKTDFFFHFPTTLHTTGFSFCNIFFYIYIELVFISFDSNSY